MIMHLNILKSNQIQNFELLDMKHLADHLLRKYSFLTKLLKLIVMHSLDATLRLIGSFAFQNTIIENIYIPSRFNLMRMHFIDVRT